MEELELKDLLGRYKTPIDGKAELILTISNNTYKLEKGNLVEISSGTIELNFDKDLNIFDVNLENIGKAKLVFRDKYGFYFGFIEKSEGQDFDLREYSFWKI